MPCQITRRRNTEQDGRKDKMLNFVKELLCKHEYITIETLSETLYGSGRIFLGQLQECKKCGKIRVK